MGKLLEKITADMKAALKARDEPRLRVTRMLIAAIKQVQIDQGKDVLGDDEEQALVLKALKARKDAVAEAQRLGRQDVAASEGAEAAIVEGYLPSRMAPAELEAAVRALAAEIGYAGPKDQGRFMKEWMARHKGRAEGRDVQAALGRL